MSRGKHSESEMIAALKQVEAGRKVEDGLTQKGKSLSGGRTTTSNGRTVV